MTTLRTHVDEYLALRRSLGYKLRRDGFLLADFATYHEQTGHATVTAQMMLAWAQQAADATPNWRYRRLGVVRHFAIYLSGIDPTQEIPPSDLLPARAHRPTPYIYSHADVLNLIATARNLPNNWQRTTLPTIVGLLAVTGMRVGEALNLDRTDVDWSDGLLVLRGTKFGKSREVVLHPTVVQALRTYDCQRRMIVPHPKAPAFFLSTTGLRIHYQTFCQLYLDLVRRVGLEAPFAGCLPQAHGLRHTFAVNTLLSWHRAGIDVSERMHLLSTYLGHGDPVHTYWYLSAVPELMTLVAERLEHSQEESS